MNMTDLEHENFRYVVQCDWIRCAAGMKLAGSGRCSLDGDWRDGDCPMFVKDDTKWWEAE